MNFGTKGCMYNCGDECTGECIKVETKTKMSKEEILHIEHEMIIWLRNYNRLPNQTELSNENVIRVYTKKILNQNKDE